MAVGWGGPDGYLRPVQFLDHLTVIKISFFIVFRFNDDLSPVEVAGVVMPKRTP